MGGNWKKGSGKCVGDKKRGAGKWKSQGTRKPEN